ncbi:VCBS domain-containing protein [Salinivibrio proteolyticus]|uniref:VCBS domain-containing protein n=1 Tax=Salinivibrio proteolyticus TaxID=334715 RepID=A0ABY7LKC6_9GAMM|nr:VCBS domain-containing protein [Salinivibrio proteolyticus]WBA16651.1 VCBS domain-containing protein [Salinivibrio proteolyticus]
MATETQVTETQGTVAAVQPDGQVRQIEANQTVSTGELVTAVGNEPASVRLENGVDANLALSALLVGEGEDDTLVQDLPEDVLEIIEAIQRGEDPNAIEDAATAAGAAASGSAITAMAIIEANGRIGEIIAGFQTEGITSPDGGITDEQLFALTALRLASADAVFPAAETNEAPSAESLTFSTDEDQPLVLTPNQILQQINDPDGDTLTIVSITSGNPDVEIDEDASGNIVITPPPNFNGDLDLTVIVSDGQAETPSDITVTVNPVNDAPTLQFSATTVTEDAVAAGDTVGTVTAADIEGDALTLSLTDDGQDYVELQGNNVVLTQAGVDAINNDALDIASLTFTVTASDGETSTSQTFTSAVERIDDPASITGDTSGTLSEGEIDGSDGSLIARDSVSGTLSISDSDDNPTWIDSAESGQYGELVFTNGNWTYTADSDALQSLSEGDAVSDNFTVTASDGSSQVISITITGTNDDPVISGQTLGDVVEDSILEATGSLSISDADGNNAPSFSDGDVSGQYGELSLVNGTWTYTLDNNSSVIQGLDAGDQVTDTITLTASDGTQQDIVITITGTDDVPEVSGEFVGSVTEGNEGDAPVTATGTLAISDVDDGDSPTFADTTETGTYGSLELVNGNWTYTLDQFAVQSLDAGDQITDTITLTASDGTEQDIVITIMGTDDAPEVSGSFVGSVTEGNEGDAPVTATGTLAINDVDDDDTPIFSDVTQAGTYGSLELVNGSWTYTLNQSSVQNLDAGDQVTDTITLTASDGTEQAIVITITGSEDAPEVTGSFTGSVTEGNEGDAPVTATGTIAITDVDDGNNPTFANTTEAGTYGSLELINGNWTYTLNQASVQNLDAGDQVTDTITLTASDGTEQAIVITITGSEDAPEVSGEFVGSVTEGDVGDAAVTATGTIAISDVDGDDAPTFADTTETGAYGSLELVGENWTYTLDQSAVQNLDAGDQVTDTITLTASDGTEQAIVITITGSEDAPEVTGSFVGSVTEGNEGDAPVTATGTIAISDVDGDDTPTFADTTEAGTYGSLELVNGNWTYTLDQDSVQNLDAGDQVTDTITLTASDNTQLDIVITITGTDDDPEVTGEFVGSVTEGNEGDAPVTATGTIAISDVDGDDTPTFADTTETGTYGSLELVNGNWTYTLVQASVQDLDADEQVTDTITLTASDGTEQAIVITITGSEDLPEVTGEFVGSVTEGNVGDAAVTATGTIAITDVDGDDTPTFADTIETGTYGSLELVDDDWTYTLDQSAVQNLDAGDQVTDTITLTASDGTEQAIVITITGSEDAPEVTGSFVGSVTEGNEGDEPVTATGTIAISDVDGDDTPTFADITEIGTYGSLELVNGNWTYTLDQSAVQNLDAGDQVTDTITLTASDNTQQDIVITITGSEDLPEVTGEFVGSVTEGNVGDAAVTATGTLAISDVDGDDNPTFADTTASGTYGSLELVNGNWTYTLNQTSVQDLDAGDQVTDTITLTASDGTPQDIVITITGTDDDPVVSGEFVGSVTEGNEGDAPFTATGTIAINDVDGDDNPSFADTTASGTYGSLELVDGDWTYTLDQSAVQNLDAGDQVTDTITLTASDGTEQDIVISITGTDDAPEVTGNFTGSVTEGNEGDAPVTATGTIAISDIDSGDNPTFGDTTEAGTYGSLELVNGNWTYTLDQSAVQNLDAGDQVTDTITLTASDNTQQDIVITITGSDDLPEVSGEFIGSVTEGNVGDGPVTATGTLAISDVDSNDAPTFANTTASGTYGSLELVDGNWTYTLDQSAVQNLDAGDQVTDTITLTASDGTEQAIVITITGSEDAPEVSGEFVGSVTEGNEGDAAVTATGTITISDIDSGDNPTFGDTTASGTYGSLELVDGSWTYTLDQSAVQNLDAGDQVTDTITLTASDNTQQDIVITITGSEDLPEVSGEFIGSVTEGNEGDAPVTATGTIAISDIDSGDNPTFADTTETGTYGSLELVDGNWTYTLDQSAVQNLDAGDQVTDTITLTASDGTEQDIVISITGTDDAPEVTGNFTGSVTEGNEGDAPVTATGTITISDIDSGDNPTFGDTTASGTYGSLELVDGSWTYTLDQSAVQNLDAGDQVTDTITLTASDNTQQDIVITITGSEDLPEVSGEFIGSVTEGNVGDAAVTASGTIAISDVDVDDAPTFADTTETGSYGSLELVGENWTYTLDQSAVQNLDAGDQVTDTITLTASDGTEQAIVITITGSEDAPEVTGSFVGSVTEGNVGDAPVTATGTIAISDVDVDDAPTFADTTETGSYGSLELVGENWTYTLDQSAVQNLDAGDQVTDTITLTASDGTEQAIVITITGSEDAPEVTGSFVGSVTEGNVGDAPVTATGTIAISDVDGDDAPTFADTTETGSYGSLELVGENWTYTLDQSAVQNLDAGDQVTDTITLTASDGTEQAIVITITGSEDAPEVTGSFVGSVTEGNVGDAPVTASGTIDITDVDGNDTPTFADTTASGTYGSLELVDGNWTYTLDQSAVQNLDAGDQVTDTITLTASDNTQQDIVITITGSEDLPEVSGEFIGSVTEGNEGDAPVTATGTIAISDIDSGDNPTFGDTTASGTYGSLELVDGSWTYTLDQSAVQNLDAGDQVTDTITLTASDNTQQDIVITITGSEDLPEVSGEFIGSVTEGNVGDAAVTASGTIAISDIDGDDAPTFADTTETGAYGSLELVGENWTYTLDQSAVQNLDAGDQVTDTITLTASDGTEQAIVITITGSEDAPEVTGSFVGSVTEGNVGDAPVTATGTIAISDVDVDDAPTFADTTETGSYGSLELVGENWTYTLDQSAVQNLDAGDQVTDTITLTASDGTEQAIVITITGSEDAPEVTGSFVGSVTEGNVGDAPVTATGTIAISDVDVDDAPTFADTTETGSYGSLELVGENWTYTLDQSAVQNLDAGDQVTDTITLTASDGTEQAIVITITGSEDTPEVTGNFVGSVTEGNEGDAAVTASGTIAINDVDSDDTPAFADTTETGNYGSLELVNGNWTYTLDQASVQNLDAGDQVTDTITLTASDGTEQAIVITITGSEDLPEVTGEFVGSVTEGDVGDAAVTASGTLAISDVDDGDNPTFADTSETGTYGSLELVDGNWTYTLDQSAVQNLDAGDQVTDTITLTASDNTQQDIVITITGSEDLPEVTGEFVGSVTEGNEGDAAVTASGTIAINDVDGDDTPAFANTTASGTYGSLELVDGSWTYTLDQSAVQNLDAGDQVTDTITLTASDNTQQDIVITITGSEDLPEVTGEFVGSVTEGNVGDAAVTATGTLAISDVDGDDNPTFANTTETGTYGSLELLDGNWTYTLDQSAVQDLDAGDQVTDTITLTASDGTEQAIVITITGTDDDPEVTGEFVGSVTEGDVGDAAVTASGTLAISDVDDGDNPTFADTSETGTYGSLELVDGNWTYTLDQSAVQNLDAGDQVTDTITLTASDNTQQDIVITITGADDDPEVTGEFVGSVTEGDVGDAAVTASGTIAITDVDGDDTPTFADTTETGSYGSLELVNGSWTYTLDQSAVQNLDAGDQITDTITLTASDGTEQDIVITITGTDDDPVVSGEFVGSVTEGNVGDAAVTATGTLAISDVDGDDNPTFANTTETGTYGSLELLDGNWTYTLDQSAVQDLDAGDQVTDTITLTASDGTEQDIVITITGSEDAPEVSGEFVGSVTEGNVGDAAVTATGTIAISDIDGDDTPTFTDTTETGAYGSLELVDGSWTYTLDQSAVQHLDAGDQVTDTITLTASDNTQQDIVITITGTDDDPEVIGEFVGSVTEGNEGDAPVTATGTIAISDVDTDDAPTFADVTQAGTYGSLELVDGDWTYTLDQSAVQNLDDGDQVTDTITLIASDNTQQDIVITITGSEDAPEVSGEFVGSVTEGNVGDAPVTATGTIAISDVDGDDAPSFANTTETGTYGSLELVNGNWTYTLDQASVQNLDDGDQVTDTITLIASDNTQQDIVITITGSEDAPEVSGEFVGSVTEGNEGDAPVTATGTIAISDVDGDDTPTFADTTETGTYGSLELVNGNWTYTLDQSAVQNLDAGDQVTDTITLTASDNTQQDIVITITGSEDTPEVTGSFIGSVTEGNVGDAPVTASGTLSISDVDGDDNPTFANTTETGTYGSLELVDGDWTYTLDQDSVQDLDAGDQVTDTITLTASDGTEQAIVITITGSEDAPEVSGEFVGSVTEGNEGDAPVTATGTIAISDVDGDDTPTFADTTETGTYGSLELVNGNWTYTLDQDSVQDLDAGDQVTDTITLTASDGTEQAIVITITGSEDAPEVSGEFIGSVTEGDVGDAPVTATGTIAISDVDGDDTPTFADTTEAGTYGSLELVDGNWTYTLDQSAVQSLDAGDQVTDTITLTATNGVQQDIDITITGTNDAPILTQAVSTQTLQEDFVSYAIDLNTVFSDVDSNDTLSFDVANVPSGVSVSIDANGIATISSVADWSGTETVSFRATDTQNASLTHDVIFNIEGVATAPTLTVSRGDQSLTYIDSAGQISATDPGAGGSRAILSPLTISGTANETGETLTYRIGGLPDDAVLSAGTKEASSGDWLLTDAQLSGLSLASPADITGITLSITAISTDGTDQASTTVTLNLENDSFALTEGQTSSIASVDGLISNDTDTQATVTRVATNASQGENGNSEIVIGPATIATALGGSVTVNADGSFTYTAPAVNHAGGGQVYDSFSYQSSENSEWTTVTFDVSDSAPVAHDDSDSVASGASTGGNVITAGDGADTLGADTTTVSAVSFNGTTYAVNGSTVIATSQGQLTIQPDGSYLYQSSVPSTTDASTLDDEIFTYTLTDSDGDTSQAQLTLGHDNNTQLNADIASVSEQGLVRDDNSHTTQGNLLDNDTGIGVNVNLYQVNGQSFGSDGVLTLTTASGTLTIYNENNNQGYRAGDYTYTLNNATSGDNVSEAFTYTTYDPTASTTYRSSTLTINVQDDTPTSDNIESALYATAESSSTFNLILTVDLSGSMADPVDPNDPNSPTRMEVTKAALKSMVEEYDKLGDLNIQIVSFSSEAQSSGWMLNDIGSALDAIEGLYAGGGTRYDNALNEIINTVDTSGLTADKTISYFISDGMPNDDFENNSSLQNAWQNYVSTQGIDESFSVGVGDGITTSPLTPIAASSSGSTSDNVLLVTDENELAYSLLQTIESGQVSGGLVLMDDDGNTVSLFGADGGYISALTLDGQTYNYDPATDSAQQTFETEKGGILTINFDTGEYDYRVAVDRDILNEQEQIALTLTDNDGDTSNVNVAINLYYEARLDANHDIVITNIHDGSPIVIPGLALTHNDIPSMGSTITATGNAVQGSVAGTDDIIFTPDSAMSPQTFLDPIGNDSEFIAESELGDFANSFAQAQSLDRGKFGTMTQEVWAHIDAGNYGANAALTGTVQNGTDSDMTKMDLYQNETLLFDDDRWWNDLSVRVYDQNQQLLDTLNPDTGSNSFTAGQQGTYYFEIVSNNTLNTTEDYEIYLTLDSSNAVLPEPEHQFEYTTSNGSYVDSALVDIIAIDDQTLEGGYQSEILAAGTGDDTLIGNEGDDSLLGNHGDDTLDGGLGDDLLIGGKGDDTLTGGLGSDTFAFLSGDQGSVGAEAVDRITDFDVQKDTLDLSELLIDEDQAGASLEDYLTLEDNDQGEATLYIASAGDNQIDQHVVFENLSVADMAAAYEIDISGLSSQELSASVIDAMIQQSKLMTD